MITSRRNLIVAASLLVLATGTGGCKELSEFFGWQTERLESGAAAPSDAAASASDERPLLPAFWATPAASDAFGFASPKLRPSAKGTAAPGSDVPASDSIAATPKSSASPTAKPSARPSVSPKPAPSKAPQFTMRPEPTPIQPGQAAPTLPPAPPPAAAKPEAKPSQTPLHIEAETARYDRRTKIALASGNVLIQQEETEIRAEDAQYDENAKTSYVNDAVRVYQKDKKTKRETNISAFRLTAFHEEKRIILEQDVKMDIGPDPRPIKAYKEPAKSDAEKRRRIEEAIRRARTIITSQEMEYWTRRKDASFVGNVEVIQPQKRATADRATMIDSTGTITLEGKAHLEQIRGDWLKGLGVLPKDQKDDKEFKRALENKAIIEADTIIIEQNTNDVLAQGNVKITQKGRVAYADRAVYTELDGLVNLIDNVKLLKENGDWLKADKALMDTRSDRFEALGAERQVETSFTVDEEGKEAPSRSPSPPTPLQPPAMPAPQPSQSLPPLPRRQ